MKKLTIIIILLAVCVFDAGAETLYERLDPDGDGYVVAGGEFETYFDWSKLRFAKKPRLIPVHYFLEVEVYHCGCCQRKEKADEEKKKIKTDYNCAVNPDCRDDPRYLHDTCGHD